MKRLVESIVLEMAENDEDDFMRDFDLEGDFAGAEPDEDPDEPPQDAGEEAPEAPRRPRHSWRNPDPDVPVDFSIFDPVEGPDGKEFDPREYISSVARSLAVKYAVPVGGDVDNLQKELYQAGLSGVMRGMQTNPYREDYVSGLSGDTVQKKTWIHRYALGAMNQVCRQFFKDNSRNVSMDATFGDDKGDESDTSTIANTIEDENAVSPSERFSKDEDIENVRAALSQLSPKESELAMAILANDMSPVEAGKRLGIASSTVSARMQLVRTKLRRILMSMGYRSLGQENREATAASAQEPAGDGPSGQPGPAAPAQTPATGLRRPESDYESFSADIDRIPNAGARRVAKMYWWFDQDGIKVVPKSVVARELGMAPASVSAALGRRIYPFLQNLGWDVGHERPNATDIPRRQEPQEPPAGPATEGEPTL